MQYPTYACAYELDAVTFQLPWTLFQHHLILSLFHDLTGKILPVLFSVLCSLSPFFPLCPLSAVPSVLRTENNSKKQRNENELRTGNCALYMGKRVVALLRLWMTRLWG